MFTGIIEAVGKIDSVTPSGGMVAVWVGCERLDLSDVAIGDSIAVNGVCLTVTESEGQSMKFDV